MDADLKERLSSLVRRLETTVPYAAALYKRSAGTRLVVNRFEETVQPASPTHGLVFTLWNGERFLEHAVNQWSWKDLEEDLLCRATAFEAERNPGQSATDIDPGPPLIRDFTGPGAEDTAREKLNDKIDRARRRLNDALHADPQRIVNAVCVHGDLLTEDLFVNRTKILSQRLARTDVYVMVFASDGAQTVELFKGTSKNGGSDAADLSTEEIRRLSADATRLLGATRLSPGTYDVVADPDWAGIIAHECFGHGMETDLYVRGRALSQRYIGQNIASDIVNMSDDPSLIGEAGGFFFDDEGQLAGPTRIIENGILKRGLTDLASAHKLGIPRSANGRREGFARKAYARMTNTFFENGDATREEILASLENGLILRYATNGMEDPQGWGIQVEGLWAEEVRAGKPTGKVFSPVIMTGFVPDLLTSISMVGNDRAISGLGICGKGHKEWIKNTTGGPHLKMRARLG